MDNQQEQTIHQGRVTQVVRSEVQDIVIDQENIILNRLISLHRSGELTNDFLRGSIGEISGLRKILEDMEITIRQGIVEQEKVANNG